MQEVKDRLVAELEHFVSRFSAMRSTLETLDDIEARGIEGDFVECGVLRGGHMLLAKAYGKAMGFAPRKVWLFDTFDGMPEPGEHDFKYNGEPASVSKERKGPNWLKASLETVRANFERFDVLDESVVFVEGKVEETLVSGPLPDQIAFLRLDTDFYSSTKVELEILYPRLVSGGVLVIDDYGFWKGARKAADEYFSNPVAWQVIDHAARMMVKP